MVQYTYIEYTLFLCYVGQWWAGKLMNWDLFIYKNYWWSAQSDITYLIVHYIIIFNTKLSVILFIARIV